MSDHRSSSASVPTFLLSVVGCATFLSCYVLFQVGTRHLGLDAPDLAFGTHRLNELVFFAAVFAVPTLVLTGLLASRVRFEPNRSNAAVPAGLVSAFALYVLLVPGAGAVVVPGPFGAAIVIVALTGVIVAVGVGPQAHPSTAVLGQAGLLLLLGGATVGSSLLLLPFGGCVARDDVCLAEKAVKTSNLGFCDLARDPRSCDDEVFRRSPAEHCTRLSKGSPRAERCGMLAAYIHRNVVVCENVVSPASRGRCVEEFAASLPTPAQCWRSGLSKEQAERCVVSRVGRESSPEVCSLVGSGVQDDCLSKLAFHKLDLESCDLLLDADRRDACRLVLAARSGDRRACAAVSTERRDACRTILASAGEEPLLQGPGTHPRTDSERESERCDRLHDWQRCNARARALAATGRLDAASSFAAKGCGFMTELAQGNRTERCLSAADLRSIREQSSGLPGEPNSPWWEREDNHG